MNPNNTGIQLSDDAIDILDSFDPTVFNNLLQESQMNDSRNGAVNIPGTAWAADWAGGNNNWIGGNGMAETFGSAGGNAGWAGGNGMAGTFAENSRLSASCS
jgi:hypothetical protein